MSQKQLESQTITFCRNTAQETVDLFMRLFGARLPERLRQDRELLSVVRQVYQEISGPKESGCCGSHLEEVIVEANHRCAGVSYPMLADIAVTLHRKDYLASMMIHRIEHMLPSRSDTESCDRLRGQFDPNMMPREFVTAFLEVMPKMVGSVLFSEIQDRCAIVADRYRFSGSELLDWRGFFHDDDLNDLRKLLFEHIRNVFVSEKGSTYLKRHMEQRYAALGMERRFGDGNMRQIEQMLRPQEI